MDSPIEHIVEELRTQLAPLESEELRLRATLAGLKDQRKKIEAALTVLGGGAEKAKPPGRTKSCATKPEVVQIVRELLRANGPLPLSDLKDLAKERLAEDTNRSLSGFGLRFQEALRESTFLVAAGVVSLAKPENSQVA